MILKVAPVLSPCVPLTGRPSMSDRTRSQQPLRGRRRLAGALFRKSRDSFSPHTTNERVGGIFLELYIRLAGLKHLLTRLTKTD